MGEFVRKSRGAALATGAVLAGGVLAAAPPARAAGAVPVPCNAASLAAAIIAANGAGPAVLRLAPRCTYSITTPATTANGLPLITGNITLAGGPSTTIRRDPAAPTAFRLLDVATGATLRVAGISILNGSTAGLGGGVQNAGTLTLFQTTLSGNAADNGGAVANLAGATATISRSVVSANNTTSVGGGGVLNFGTLTAFNSVFSANSAPINGGGVNTQPSGTTRLVESTFDRNVSGSLGGAISNLGTTELVGTLVLVNRGSAGGGIATGNTNVTLRRSIVRDNIPDNCSPANTIAGCVN